MTTWRIAAPSPASAAPPRAWPPAPGGFARLLHREAAVDMRLMRMSAGCRQVPVAGGRGMESAGCGVHRGNHLRVHPVRPDGGRPRGDSCFRRFFAA